MFKLRLQSNDCAKLVKLRDRERELFYFIFYFFGIKTQTVKFSALRSAIFSLLISVAGNWTVSFRSLIPSCKNIHTTNTFHIREKDALMYTICQTWCFQRNYIKLPYRIRGSSIRNQTTFTTLRASQAFSRDKYRHTNTPTYIRT